MLFFGVTPDLVQIALSACLVLPVWLIFCSRLCHAGRDRMIFLPFFLLFFGHFGMAVIKSAASAPSPEAKS